MKALRISLFVLLVLILGLWMYGHHSRTDPQRAVTNFTQRASEWLTDGRLHIVFLGTGTSAPEADHAQSGLAFVADGQMILIDAGSGVVRNAEIMKLPLHKLTALFYTHLHPDHIDDTAALLDACWRNGCRHKVRILGPMGQSI